MAFSLYREERARDSVSDNLAIRIVATVGSTRGLCSDCRLASHIGGVSTARAVSSQYYVKRHGEVFPLFAALFECCAWGMGHKVGKSGASGGVWHPGSVEGQFRMAIRSARSQECSKLHFCYFVLHASAFGSNSGGTQSHSSRAIASRRCSTCSRICVTGLPRSLSSSS